MPKVELDGEQQFNLSLAIVGLVLREGSMSVLELSEHFSVSEASIERAVKAIANSEDLHRYETHFFVDQDLLDEGEVSFTPGLGNLTDAPTLTKKQASAIAAGLDYLASLPQFSQNRDLADLRQALGGSITKAKTTLDSSSGQLEVLRESILAKKQCRLDYLNQIGERTERLVDPLRLDFVGNRYYLRAWCHKNKDLRAFRLDRIVGVTRMSTATSLVSSRAEIPDEVYGSGQDQNLVQLRCKGPATELFWNFPLNKEPKLVDGFLVGEIRVGNLRALGRHVARYGSNAEVLGPELARTAVKEYALAALALQEDA